jgi:plasmid maintenance system antidote protein VapI
MCGRYERFGNWLRKIGLSNREVARLFGVSETTIRLVVAGDLEITSLMLIRLTKRLKQKDEKD